MLFLGSVAGCTKKDKYYRFSEKELDFVSYSQGQTLKFLDTLGQVQTVPQLVYRREMVDVTYWSLWGGREFLEQYEVRYSSGQGISLDVSLEAGSLTSGYGFSLMVNNFWRDLTPEEEVASPVPTVINGQTYQNVYTFTAYPTSGGYKKDSATVFWNREYGLIQLLYSNGKSITRTD
ncbi:hypothetical protein GU926_10090 [Nibribacter ruber]|uniref:Uncharacterized protein n=1 Tax=Nibribacter ruber TaxID=2698458 RepID=A0A6P1NZP5_9BACT|nr:hypothetical protein [Nibribacter ruber]QHL87759.1 hypothetical protein GU926_10090 [Nibribacter ruber]